MKTLDIRTPQQKVIDRLWGIKFQKGIEFDEFNKLVVPLLDSLIALAHSSGVEEERNRIIYIINHHKINSFEKGELLGEIIKAISPKKE